jgi:putative transposase
MINGAGELDACFPGHEPDQLIDYGTAPSSQNAEILRRTLFASILDVCTRRVLSWAMHQILDARLVMAGLRRALLQRRPKGSLILHSDYGAQFARAAYRQLLAQHGLVALMSRKGNCYDNAFIESFWSTLKYEVVYHQRFATFAAARTETFDYIGVFYNHTRCKPRLILPASACCFRL